MLRVMGDRLAVGRDAVDAFDVEPGHLHDAERGFGVVFFSAEELESNRDAYDVA